MSLLSQDAFVEDVVFLIATQCLKMQRLSLISLASCSRQLRLVCMPLVFSTSSIKSIRFCSTPIPPPGIRPYIRRLIHVGTPDPVSFEELLKHLPEIRAVVFNCAHARVPLAVVEQCYRHAGIASLSFADTSACQSAWAYTTTHCYPGKESHPNSLKQLSYAANLSKPTRASYYQVDCPQEDIVAELGPIILRMHLSAESLSFTPDRAPLARMADLPWPCLRDLTLTGRYSDASQVSSVPQLVSAMRNPRSLSIQVGQLADRPRPTVLERECTEMRALESLTLAYPDPDDAIFAIAGPSLRYLSIRDHPRHYLKNMPVNRRLAMPILSSSECLRVLSRMSMPRLEHLELVYEGDDLEEELLVHVASSYSHLHTFELHQYRHSPHGPAPLRYNRISEIVRSLDTLRTLRLNLDYAYQDAAIPQPRARADDDDDAYKSRWASAEELVLYGSEILTILERREGFHVLAELYLLYCDPNTCRRWVRFLPSRYSGTVAEPIDWGLDPESLDSPRVYHLRSRRKLTRTPSGKIVRR